MNFTLDDSSPRIKYFSTSTNTARGWQRAIRGGDPGQMKYFKQTFALTVGEGDRMVLAFNGSSVWVYGSKWFNHGAFSANIDDRKPVIQSGLSSDRIFQTLLYSVTDLDPSREHIVTLTNLPSASKVSAGTDVYLDIDYIVIQQPMPTPIFTTEIDNLSPRIRYGGSWVGPAQNSSSTVSNSPGDTGTLLFNGTSVEVFGSLAPDRGNFTASVDGMNKGFYTGSWVEPLSDVSLFSISGLSETEHTLTLTNLGGNKGNVFDIDRIIFNSTIDPQSYPSSGSSSKSNTGGLIGGIVGAIAALAIIAGAIFWWLRRKKGSQRTDTALIDLTGDEVKPYRQTNSPNEGTPMATEYILSSDGHSSIGDRYYSSPAYPILSIPQPPGSNVSSYPRSTVAGSTIGTDPPTPYAQGRYTSQLSMSQTSQSHGPFTDQLSAIDPFHRSNSPPSKLLTPAINTMVPNRQSSFNASPITPPPGENTSSTTASRPSFLSDQKSSSAASIIHTLRYQDSPINDDAARSRRADEDEARMRLVKRAEEDDARERRERRTEEEEVMTMPPPYA